MNARRRSSGRALKPGPSWFAPLALALGAVVLAGCGGGGGAGHDPSALPGKTTGSYPSFLPKHTLRPSVDATLVGTETKPALTVEGLPVEVKTKAFDVRVTVSGPVVPGEGLPKQQAAATCTWTVTMRDATADVPISLADFHSVDHLGSVLLPGLVPGEHPPPSVLHRGESVSFTMRAYELVGPGQMQWAPDHKHVVGSWDYSVEND